MKQSLLADDDMHLLLWICIFEPGGGGAYPSNTMGMKVSDLKQLWKVLKR
jgi:hypothetical protein